MDAMEDAAVVIPGAYRCVRSLDSRESPFAGELVADGERLSVRVDAERVADSLWSFASAEHVAGVRDVARRSDGQDALLPWCTDTVDAFLGRRAAAGRSPTAGEIVTLVGSLLRGVAEMAERGGTGSTIVGCWWLADDGRPLFAPGEGSDCASAATEIIARVRDACTDRALGRALGEILEGLADLRVVMREIGRWEAELTELAAPRPLEREVYAPERVSAIPLHQALLPQDARRVNRQRSSVMSGAVAMAVTVRSRWERLWESARDRWPQRVAGTQKPAVPARGRGRMLLIGTAVAAAVLTGGLLWPTGVEDTSAIASAERTTQPSPSETAEPGPAASAPPSPAAGATVEQHATGLLREVVECVSEGDSRCASAVVDGAGETVLERLAGADASRDLTPIEDYGDIAVVRLGAVGEHSEQMLVIVREHKRWLVRDVYDVADQPSDAG